MTEHLDRARLRQLWEMAIAEDGVERDVTSGIAFAEPSSATARIMVKHVGVFCGEAVFDVLREVYGDRLTVELHAHDGEAMDAGTAAAVLTGDVRLLTGIERTLLNFLQRLCGVATLTRRFVDAVEGTGAKIYDTRKTIPGWRQLDKYAVRAGGGRNHRAGLHDAVLLKDNHLSGIPAARLAAAVFDMLNRAGALAPPPEFVEVEVDGLDQLDELLKVVGIDVILLDNFKPGEIREAVSRRDACGLRGKVALEASGGVTIEDVRAVAEAGVERIAVGAITHSAPALDLSMET